MTPEETMMVKLLTDRSDVFNYVVEHLRKQGCQSLSGEIGEDNCAYRGDGGTMCAVGVLISNDEYKPSWEGSSIYHLIEADLLPSGLKQRIKPNLEMLLDLQGFHDDNLKYVDGAFTEDSEFHINDLREKWGIE